MASATETVQTVTLRVAGMTCGSCERHVREGLSGVAGVREAEVSRAEGRARVSFDPAAATAEELVRAVERAGYAAEVAR